MHEAASRSAVSRLLRRHGIAHLPVEADPATPHKPFKLYEPDYLHMDIKHLPKMPDEAEWRYSKRTIK